MKQNKIKLVKINDCMEIAKYMGCFANEKRFSIVCLLREKEMTVSEIASTLGMPQSSASINLEKLYTRGLVERRRVGKFVYYQLKKDTLKMIVRKLNKLVLK